MKTQVTEWLTPLAQQFPAVRFKREIILEGGDQDRVTPTLAEVVKTAGGSAFSANQEEAQVAGKVDVIVHSLNDLPTAVHEGTLLLTTPGPREDVRDVLRGATLDGRTTRGGLDAVVLAAAGLNRLGLMPEVHQVLDPAVFPPSPGQGALGIQVRIGSQAARLLEQTGDPQVDACLRAERALLAELHGGCSVPVGAWGRVEPDGLLHLTATVTSLDGSVQVTAAGAGPVDAPEKVGASVATDVLAQGAAGILESIRGP
ncbi:hydroxymethylbilane synthase [Streptomyces sp. AA8]|uniref:hydroxymethylbilane synthase n=2 Tax=Streptomyces telluris TaxID=2720021 RepID=A0A9X2RLW4_9ACTN|nr:hydroxymethylbilane synthase [Streptomyces telluris]MCQ8771268.1 hydroxymethylbilane synthase [Streptomyces telluris]NJP82049.1 hydroxymethylbilane synthase [Streptomyces telluris]